MFQSLLFISILTIVQFSTVLYFYKKEAIQTKKGSSSTASATHALLFGLFTTLYCPFFLLKQYTLAGGHTFETLLLSHITISFFLSHILFVLVAKRVSSEFLHHLLCMIVVAFSLITNKFGQDLAMCIFLGELTFVLYLRMIAKNFRNKKLENLFEDIFVLLLFPLRLFVFPLYFFYIIRDPQMGIFIDLLAICYLLLGFYFTHKVTKKWIKRKKIELKSLKKIDKYGRL